MSMDFTASKQVNDPKYGPMFESVFTWDERDIEQGGLFDLNVSNANVYAFQEMVGLNFEEGADILQTEAAMVKVIDAPRGLYDSRVIRYATRILMMTTEGKHRGATHITCA